MAWLQLCQAEKLAFNKSTISHCHLNITYSCENYHKRLDNILVNTTKEKHALFSTALYPFDSIRSHHNSDVDVHAPFGLLWKHYKQIQT